MKAQAKSLGTVHESLVHVAYASSEGPSEPAHSCIIRYQNSKETRVADGNFVAGR